MKKITFYLSLFFISSSFAQDNCANALQAFVGSNAVGVIDGTAAPLNCTGQYSNGINADWYYYTAPVDQNVTISTESSGLDTRIHVYSGTCANLVCFDGDDDGGTGNTSLLTFTANENTTYFITFDNKWSSSAFNFVLTVSDYVEPPANDITFTTASFSKLGGPEIAVDMNKDGLDDIVTVNQNTVRINYQKNDGSFDVVDITTPNAVYTPSWSIAAGDFDGNGHTDLLYGDYGGATFMLANTNDNSNTSHNYTSTFNELDSSLYIFSQRTNFQDINNDGLLDAFVCHDVGANVYFINDGNGGFVEHRVGDGNSVDLGILGRNYATIFIDIDNDHDSDMFISKCGGAPDATKNRLYINQGDGTYVDQSVASGLNSSIQTWSSAWGDFDNDGFMDVLVGVSNGTHSELMHNNGDGTFTDVTAGSGFETFFHQSHEYIAQDFNNDGFIDVAASGYIMLSNGDMTFTQSLSTPGKGAIGDFNNDGFMDVASNGYLQINQGNNNNWIKINTKGTTSNSDGIGARVQITSALGTQIRDVRSGTGFRYMSTLSANFGIGSDTEISNVTVYWPSGNVDSIDYPSIKTTLTIVENSSPLKINEELKINLTLYPNPTKSELTLQTESDLTNSILTIFDVQGKKVMNTKYTSNKINVSNLETGIYFLRIIQNNKVLKLKFIKE